MIYVTTRNGSRYPLTYIRLYCPTLTTLPTRTHVKKDLDAYICLFDACDKPDELYGHKSDWLNHMRTHTLQWRCSSKSHGRLTFPTEKQYLDHIMAAHPKAFTEPQLHVLAQRNSRPCGPMFELCPICGTDDVTTDLEEHISVHLQSLALKSLPPHYTHDQSEGSSGIERSSVATLSESRTTIKDSTELNTKPVFQDTNNTPERDVFELESDYQSPYRLWGGFRKYIQLNGGEGEKAHPNLENQADNFNFPPPCEADDWYQSLWKIDPSGDFVEPALFNGIPPKDWRDFEWGFLTKVKDGRYKNTKDDIVIQSMLEYIPARSQMSIMDYSLERDRMRTTGGQSGEQSSSRGLSILDVQPPSPRAPFHTYTAMSGPSSQHELPLTSHTSLYGSRQSHSSVSAFSISHSQSSRTTVSQDSNTSGALNRGKRRGPMNPKGRERMRATRVNKDVCVSCKLRRVEVCVFGSHKPPSPPPIVISDKLIVDSAGNRKIRGTATTVGSMEWHVLTIISSTISKIHPNTILVSCLPSYRRNSVLLLTLYVGQYLLNVAIAPHMQKLFMINAPIDLEKILYCLSLFCEKYNVRIQGNGGLWFDLDLAACRQHWEHEALEYDNAEGPRTAEDFITRNQIWQGTFRWRSLLLVSTTQEQDNWDNPLRAFTKLDGLSGFEAYSLVPKAGTSPAARPLDLMNEAEKTLCFIATLTFERIRHYMELSAYQFLERTLSREGVNDYTASVRYLGLLLLSLRRRIAECKGTQIWRHFQSGPLAEHVDELAQPNIEPPVVRRVVEFCFQLYVHYFCRYKEMSESAQQQYLEERTQTFNHPYTGIVTQEYPPPMDGSRDGFNTWMAEAEYQITRVDAFPH